MVLVSQWLWDLGISSLWLYNTPEPLERPSSMAGMLPTSWIGSE